MNETSNQQVMAPYGRRPRHATREHRLTPTLREAPFPAGLGSSKAVALKIAGDELSYEGMHLTDMQEVVRHLDSRVRVDYYVVAWTRTVATRSIDGRPEIASATRAPMPTTTAHSQTAGTLPST